MPLIRTHLANHIRASSREEWLHQQARHMTAPDRNRHHANSALDAGRRPHMTQRSDISRMRAVLWVTAPVGLRLFAQTRAILQEVAMLLRAPADGSDCEAVPSS